jgi:hypothetical protein
MQGSLTGATAKKVEKLAYSIVKYLSASVMSAGTPDIKGFTKNFLTALVNERVSSPHTRIFKVIKAFLSIVYALILKDDVNAVSVFTLITVRAGSNGCRIEAGELTSSLPELSRKE